MEIVIDFVILLMTSYFVTGFVIILVVLTFPGIKFVVRIGDETKEIRLKQVLILLWILCSWPSVIASTEFKRH